MRDGKPRDADAPRYSCHLPVAIYSPAGSAAPPAGAMAIHLFSS